MKRVFNAMFRRFAAIRRNRFLRTCQAVAAAPYDATIYEMFLESALRNRGLQHRPFLESSSPAAPASLYVRHDIDTAACIRSMDRLLEIDRSKRISAGVYFRVDGEEYCLEQNRERINQLREYGFEIGLHTVCYLADDYLKRFEAETRAFEHGAGFHPKSFTVHGLGQTRMDVRTSFCEEIVDRMAEFGYEFTDCHPRSRCYDHVIHDCHLDQQGGHRYIRDEFTSRPFPYERGKNYLLLTHPCYWSFDVAGGKVNVIDR